MISGAIYREGIARTPDGAPYIYISATIPSPAVPIKGATEPIPAKLLTSDGAIWCKQA